MLEMMLLRHAKSDWDADYSHDRDRPLNRRGRRSAAAVGDFVSQSDIVPDLALLSPAVRARTTFELAADAGDWTTSHRIEPSLYSGGSIDVLRAVQAVEGLLRLMVVGHQPTMSTTVSRLVGGGSYRVPTGALILIHFNCDDWSEVDWGIGEFRSITLSRDLLATGYGAG